MASAVSAAEKAGACPAVEKEGDETPTEFRGPTRKTCRR
jgi:hypothetical protein